MADTGLVTIASHIPQRATLDRLIAGLADRGLTLFVHIDHAGGAADAGLVLLPTDLVIFGNARGGTPLMQDQRTAGLDLPLKILIWEDELGQAWITYNAMDWIAQRHGLGPDSASAIQALDAALAAIAHEAAK